jgi:SAM-dependent methyltransferase
MSLASLRNAAIAAIAVTLATTVLAQAWHDQDNGALDVIYLPTPHAVVKRMLELAKAGPDDILYDLGSGDGRIVIAAAKNFGVKKGVGIDLDAERIQEANENLSKTSVGKRVTFRQQNIFETDFSEATVISLYLLTNLNLKLRPTILNMKPGTRVVTQSFGMQDWKPDHFEVVPHSEGGFSNTRDVYLYIVPAKIGGRWTMDEGERRLTLEIEQKFQFFTGAVSSSGRSAEIKYGKLDGANIRFTVEVDGKSVTYEGKVEDNTITGNGWTAKRAS